MAQLPALQRFNNACLGDGGRTARASCRNSADRARVDWAIISSTMPSLFAYCELTRHDNSAISPVLCVGVKRRNAYIPTVCAILNSGIESEEPEGRCHEDEESEEFQETSDVEDASQEPKDKRAALTPARPTVIPKAEPLVKLMFVGFEPITQRPAMEPSHLPPADLGGILNALGVVEGMRGRMFCCGREHRAELAGLLAWLGGIARPTSLPHQGQCAASLLAGARLRHLEADRVEGNG
ncbi:hypothetical protein [Defluviimonas sp. WL0075]|uniref:Uncharacterized protein n=1 Tax=Albidovulum sediminicola TaxID=2984331 RepID=A0ABT2Z1N9_9RHOB|nr:hypothetical protein [Defluviimonas sp. WL0075]MCV2865010.1 hypothetical protein [Defluviimonas sp. WL0075]